MFDLNGSLLFFVYATSVLSTFTTALLCAIFFGIFNQVVFFDYKMFLQL